MSSADASTLPRLHPICSDRAREAHIATGNPTYYVGMIGSSPTDIEFHDGSQRGAAGDQH